jgi:sec-independent protein translocase protein TatC
MSDVTHKPSDFKPGHDEIEASKAPLLEHLIELRQRLIYALAAVMVFFFVCFFFANGIFNILAKPCIWAANGDIDKCKMIYTAPQEYLFAQIKLALFGAVFLAFPVIANQVYKFVAPGLYKNEKQAFLPYLIATPVLFFLGACVVYFLVMPMALRFFIEMGQAGNAGQIKIEMMSSVDKYLSLIMTMILGFGICFQLPVIVTLLAKAGVVSSASLQQFRRYAYVGIAAVSAVLSPPDPFSMIAMMLPTWALYEASIYAVKYYVEAKQKDDVDKT